ncbi:MAG: hypothetical protein FWG88_11820, partial [Oscillospiraceae bacterium]|nr:hypothetical protein [Oscillospiraceae bacterium]
GETKKAHTELFLELIEKIDDSCEIYADITYGTKPTPMIIFALLTFIDSIRINSDVRQVVYGKIVWRPRIEGQASEIESAHIFDVTQLLNIIAITESLRALDGSNIEEAIKLLFSLEGGE